MTMQTRTWLFDTHAAALAAVRDLEAAGFTQDEVSILGESGTTVVTSEEPTNNAGVGASIGGVVGGGAGLLAGLGIMAIPGIGPLVAAGWLAATLAGAGAGLATGGVIGSLVKSGV